MIQGAHSPLRDSNSSLSVCFLCLVVLIQRPFYIAPRECWASKCPFRALKTQPTLPTFHASHQRLFQQKPKVPTACVISTGGK